MWSSLSQLLWSIQMLAAFAYFQTLSAAFWTIYRRHCILKTVQGHLKCRIKTHVGKNLGNTQSTMCLKYMISTCSICLQVTSFNTHTNTHRHKVRDRKRGRERKKENLLLKIMGKSWVVSGATAILKSGLKGKWPIHSRNHGCSWQRQENFKCHLTRITMTTILKDICLVTKIYRINWILGYKWQPDDCSNNDTYWL